MHDEMPCDVLTFAGSDRLHAEDDLEGSGVRSGLEEYRAVRGVHLVDVSRQLPGLLGGPFHL